MGKQKVTPAFKPNMIGTLAPFIQESVQSLLLDRIRQETEKGHSVQSCRMAKRFAFEIGSKFVYGPLLNEEEREQTFTLFQQWANGISPVSVGQALNDPDNPDTEW